MPSLKRAPSEKELEKLIRIFLKAETDIINEIGRLRSLGLVDYHAVAALERVQAILRKMENHAWEYVPRMIEKEFYVRVPEARKVEEPVEKHKAGYVNAFSLSGEQMDVVQRLVMNLMGEITDASMTVMATLQSALIGRVEPDVYRRVGLEQVAAQAAAGKGANKAVPQFVQQLVREGVTAFVDKAGRNWSLHTTALWFPALPGGRRRFWRCSPQTRSRICTRSAPTAPPAPSAPPMRAGCTPARGMTRTSRPWQKPLGKWMSTGRIRWRIAG